MKSSLMLAVVVSIVLVTGSAWGHDREPIVRPFAAIPFATMPEVANFPEGIAANPYNGDIFVSTFEFDFTGTETNGIVRFNSRGRVVAKTAFSSNVPLLGLAFNRRDKKVYVASVGNFQGVPSKIQRIDAKFSDGALLEDVAIIPNIGAPADSRNVLNPDGSFDTIQFGDNAAVPNALVVRKGDGALFVSDSFQGAVFQIDDPAVNCSSQTLCTLANGGVKILSHHPLLPTAGFPAFGANGLALSKDEKNLFVANTGDDRILKVDLPSGVVQETPFVEGINGADGLAYDYDGILWVAANQADHVVGLNSDGLMVAKLGTFLGVQHGRAMGLLFPASLVIVGDGIFVTNLALPLTGVEGDEWEEKVDRYTISRIRIPRSLQ